MKILLHIVGLYILAVTLFMPDSDNLVHSEFLGFDTIYYRNSLRSEFNPGMIVLRNQYDVSLYKYQYFIPEQGIDQDIDVNYETHFVLIYFWGSMPVSDYPSKQELIRIERIAETISLYYDYAPSDRDPSQGAPDEQVGPLHIIQIEKHEAFDWDDAVEIIVYYNEDEIVRTSADLSLPTYTIFLPLIRAMDRVQEIF